MLGRGRDALRPCGGWVFPSLPAEPDMHVFRVSGSPRVASGGVGGVLRPCRRRPRPVGLEATILQIGGSGRAVISDGRTLPFPSDHAF